MTPADDRDYQLRMAARRCAFAKACQAAGTINSAIYRGAVDDAAALAEAYLAGAELRATAAEAMAFAADVENETYDSEHFQRLSVAGRELKGRLAKVLGEEP